MRNTCVKMCQTLSLALASQVLLLAMGQTAFFGPATESLGHFSSLGYLYKPGLISPADYLLEVRLNVRADPPNHGGCSSLGPPVLAYSFCFQKLVHYDVCAAPTQTYQSFILAFTLAMLPSRSPIRTSATRALFSIWPTRGLQHPLARP